MPAKPPALCKQSLAAGRQRLAPSGSDTLKLFGLPQACAVPTWNCERGRSVVAGPAAWCEYVAVHRSVADWGNACKPLNQQLATWANLCTL